LSLYPSAVPVNEFFCWGAAVLLLRRLPAVRAVTPILPQARGVQDTLFLGWFGPIGVAALFYAALSLREIGVEEAWTVGSLVICASILVHGVTAAPLTRFYGHTSKDEGSEDE
jgi:NhaP-type Na+/H+ or K+/H+ antiporter